MIETTNENDDRHRTLSTAAGENEALQPAQDVAETRRLRRLKLDKKRRRQQIDGRTVEGREAKAWSRWAYAQKGGKRACSPAVRQLIVYGELSLYKALSMRNEVIVDARDRGRLTDGRKRRLSALHYLIEQAFGEWRRINEQLGLDKPTGIDLAQLLAQRAKE